MVLLALQVCVESDDKEVLEQLAQCFDLGPMFGDGGSNEAHDLDVWIGGKTDTAEPAAGDHSVLAFPQDALAGLGEGRGFSVTSLATALNVWAVKSTRRHHVLHAGAVAQGGAGILLPGRSYSGKSTLTAGLIRSGFELLSDEIGAVEIASGRLVGYPRKLSIRRDVFSLLGIKNADEGGATADAAGLVTVGELGGHRATSSVWPKLVVFPRFQPGTEHMERLSPGHALVGLMESCCSPAHLRARSFDFFADLALRLPAYRLCFCDLQNAISLIEATFAGVVERSIEA